MKKASLKFHNRFAIIQFDQNRNVTLFLRRPSIFILALSTVTTWFIGLVNPSPMSFYAVAGFWFIFGGYIWYRMIQDGRYWLSILPAVLVVVITIGIALPIETFNELMQPLNARLAEQHSPLPAGKIGHIICFAMLSIFFLAMRKNLQVHLVDIYAVKILLAVATEGIQLFVPGRTPHLRDLVFDILGIGLGTLVYLVYERVRKSAL